MIALPVLTKEHLEMIDKCLDHLDALVSGLQELSSETHMCEHRTRITFAAELALNTIRENVEEHSTHACRTQTEAEPTRMQRDHG